MRLLFINPNSTEDMTQGIVEAARAARPNDEIIGWTNADGPPAIQGAEDGAAAVPGLMALLPAAREAAADAIVIACFDDTGLAEMRAQAHCPVVGIGEAAYHAATLLGGRFAVLTTLPVSVPVIEENIRAGGFAPQCHGVKASGFPVLEVEEGAPEVLETLSGQIANLTRDGAQSIVLGCAGMSRHSAVLARATDRPLIDPVRAAAAFAAALVSIVA